MRVHANQLSWQDLTWKSHLLFSKNANNYMNVMTVFFIWLLLKQCLSVFVSNSRGTTVGLLLSITWGVIVGILWEKFFLTEIEWPVLVGNLELLSWYQGCFREENQSTAQPWDAAWIQAETYCVTSIEIWWKSLNFHLPWKLNRKLHQARDVQSYVCWIQSKISSLNKS